MEEVTMKCSQEDHPWVAPQWMEINKRMGVGIGGEERGVDSTKYFTFTVNSQHFTTIILLHYSVQYMCYRWTGESVNVRALIVLFNCYSRVTSSFISHISYGMIRKRKCNRSQIAIPRIPLRSEDMSILVKNYNLFNQKSSISVV